MRLIGDDQQLAAVGAGGVLRDIDHRTAPSRLSELHRFTDPAEAAATLALREGDPAALGFYLDHGRIHVGDLATATEDVFAAWAADRAAGLDSIMLAPTRDLVAELNDRARDDRLAGDSTADEQVAAVATATGASVGDVIVTRTQRPPARRQRHRLGQERRPVDRQRRRHDGELHVRHTRSRLTIRAARRLRRRARQLGYATTVHAAQGITADTCTAAHRRRVPPAALHDADPRPAGNHVHLAGRRRRRPAHRHRSRHDRAAHRRPRCWRGCWPATRRRSPPSLRCASSTTQPPGCIQRSSATATASTPPPSSSSGPGRGRARTPSTRYIPGITASPAWPTLRSHLHWPRRQTGDRPYRHLLTAASWSRPPSTAGDMAAVLDWRLPDLASQRSGLRLS